MYGLSVLNFTSGDGENPFNAIFPKTTKCKYRNYGPSGSLQTHDFLCILPLNVLNEKLYLILWFWMVFLVILSFLMVIYRLLVIGFPKIRAYILLVQVRYFDLKEMEKIVDSINYGGYFVLYMIGKNCNPFIFRELVSALYDSIKDTKGRKTNIIVV